MFFLILLIFLCVNLAAMESKNIQRSRIGRSQSAPDLRCIYKSSYAAQRHHEFMLEINRSREEKRQAQIPFLTKLTALFLACGRSATVDAIEELT